MVCNEEQKVNANIFVGARALAHEEAKKLLPNYDSIIKQIESIRSASYDDVIDKPDMKEYNNIISVLGKRGTGKTSILYTINANLKNDIILPIIRPDNLSDNSTILSSVLGYLKTEMDMILESIERASDYDTFSDCFKDCRYIKNNPLKSSFVRMYEHYCYNEKDYKQILINEYNNLSSYLEKSSQILNSDEGFVREFHKFAGLLLEYRERLDKSKKNALLVILIDDIDLKSSKVEEVIEVILKYVNHSKMLFIITADYQTFVDSFVISLLSKERMDKSLNIYEELDTQKKSIISKKIALAHDYMKKIMPPAFRFEISNHDIIGRANYAFYVAGKPLDNMMTLFFNAAQACGNNDNIYFYQEHGNKKPLRVFYSILDNTSRGLVNVYYSLFNAVTELSFLGDTQDFITKTFILSKNIVDSIINSNKIFLERKIDIYENYIIWGNSTGTSRLNFKNLDLLFIHDKSSSEPDYSFSLALFNLMYFITRCQKEIAYDEEDASTSLQHAIEAIFTENGFQYKKINRIFNNKNSGIDGGLLTYSYPLSLNIIEAILIEFSESSTLKSELNHADTCYYIFYQAIKQMYGEANTSDILFNLFNDERQRESMRILHEQSINENWFDNGRIWLERLINITHGDNSIFLHLFLKSLILLSDSTELFQNIEDAAYIKNIELSATENYKDSYNEAITPLLKNNLDALYKSCRSTCKNIIDFLELGKKIDLNEEDNFKKVRLYLTIENRIARISEMLKDETKNTSITIQLGEKTKIAINEFRGKAPGDARTRYFNEAIRIRQLYEKAESLNFTGFNEIIKILSALSYRYDLVCGASEANDAYIKIMNDETTRFNEETDIARLFSSSIFKSFIRLYVAYMHNTDKMPKAKRFIAAKSYLAKDLTAAKIRSQKLHTEVNQQYDLEIFDESVKAVDSGTFIEKMHIKKFQ